MKKGSQLAPFALPLTAYFFVGWFKSESSREALKKATREERGLLLEGFFLLVRKGVGRAPLSMGCNSSLESQCAAAQDGALLSGLPSRPLRCFEWGARTRVSAALSECRPL